MHANEGMAVIPAGVILILPLLSAGFAAAIAQAAGVIAERGGPLSNGANLAREAAVPAVVLENAASLVHAGDLVVVDGASGAVIVQQERNSHHAL